MSDESHNNALDLISEILDKMIDMQQASTEAMTVLKSSIEDSNRTVHEINTHFKNGFRSEIKNHVTQEIQKVEIALRDATKELEDIEQKVEDFNEIISKPSYWVKLILITIGATATAIGAAVAAIMKLMG